MTMSVVEQNHVKRLKNCVRRLERLVELNAPDLVLDNELKLAHSFLRQWAEARDINLNEPLRKE